MAQQKDYCPPITELLFSLLSLEYLYFTLYILLTESLGKTLLSFDSAILESRQCLPVLDQVFLLDDVQNFTITRSLLRQIAALGKLYSRGFCPTVVFVSVETSDNLIKE